MFECARSMAIDQRVCAGAGDDDLLFGAVEDCDSHLIKAPPLFRETSGLLVPEQLCVSADLVHLPHDDGLTSPQAGAGFAAAVSAAALAIGDQPLSSAGFCVAESSPFMFDGQVPALPLSLLNNTSGAPLVDPALSMLPRSVSGSFDANVTDSPATDSVHSPHPMTWTSSVSGFSSGSEDDSDAARMVHPQDDSANSSPSISSSSSTASASPLTGLVEEKQHVAHSDRYVSAAPVSVSTSAATAGMKRVRAPSRKIRMARAAASHDEEEEEEEDDEGAMDPSMSKQERNKLSAARYRKRRKRYMSTLEQQVAELEAELARKNTEIARLQAELARARAENQHGSSAATAAAAAAAAAASHSAPHRADHHRNAGRALWAIFALLMLWTPLLPSTLPWSSSHAPATTTTTTASSSATASVSPVFDYNFDPSIHGHKGRVLLHFVEPSSALSLESSCMSEWAMTSASSAVIDPTWAVPSLVLSSASAPAFCNRSLSA